MDYSFDLVKLDPKNTRLEDIIIKADHAGATKSPAHAKTPKVGLTLRKMHVVASISSKPKVYIKSKNADVSKFQGAMDYIARNHDIFMKHYTDATNSFRDEELINALKGRGDYV